MFDEDTIEQKQEGKNNIQAGRDVTINKKTVSTIICAIALSGVVIVIFILGRTNSDTVLQESIAKMESQIVQETQNENSLQDMNSDFFSFRLTPIPNDLDSSIFDEAAALLEVRVKALSNDSVFDVKEDYIEIMIPQKVFFSEKEGTTNIKKIMNYLLYLSSGQMSLLFDEDEYTMQLHYTDILSCELHEDWPSGKAFILYLKDDVYRNAKKILNYADLYQGENAVFYIKCFGGENKSHAQEIFFTLAFDDIIEYNEEECALLIQVDIDEFQENGLFDLLATAMMQPSLPCEFTYSLGSENIFWETAETSKMMGTNQVDVLHGDSVELLFSSYNTQQLSEDINNMMTKWIKSKLDSLGVEYQYGYNIYGDRGYYVRLPIECVGTDVIKLLESKNQYLEINTSFQTIDWVAEFGIIKNADGTYSMEVKLPYGTMQRYSVYAMNQNELIFLSFGDVRLSSTLLSEIKDDTIIFRNLYFDGKDSISEDYYFLLSLVNHIFNNEFKAGIKYPENYYFDSFTINSDKADSSDLPFGIDCKTKWERYIENNREKYPLIKDISTEGNTLAIEISKEAHNDTSIFDFLDVIENIYLGLNFEEANYRNIVFICSSPELNHVDKVYFMKSQTGVGYVVDSARFHTDNNEKVKDYISKVSNDTFWTGMVCDTTRCFVDDELIEWKSLN